MVIEKDTDIEHIERSGVYKGKYFVLGGLVPALKSTTKESIRIMELLEHVQTHKSVLSEIILAFAFTPEGDHTRLYIETKISNTFTHQPANIKLSVLGRGLAFGSEIEYSDPATIGYALEHRISLV
jgi:recombination protein RecR